MRSLLPGAHKDNAVPSGQVQSFSRADSLAGLPCYLSCAMRAESQRGASDQCPEREMVFAQRPSSWEGLLVSHILLGKEEPVHTASESHSELNWSHCLALKSTC